jgi:hypothetical protein
MNTPHYKTKTYILRIMDTIMNEPNSVDLSINPINFLFGEITTAYKDKSSQPDKPFRILLFKLLSHYSDHCHSLLKLRRDEEDHKKRGYVKYDKFLWRVYNRLKSFAQTEVPGGDLDVYLAILADYLRNCYTDVLIDQALQIVPDSLLPLFRILLLRGKFSVDLVHLVPVCHSLLDVFNELYSGASKQENLEQFAQLFLERDEILSWTNSYAIQILSNSKMEAALAEIHGQAAKSFLKNYRARIIRHYGLIIEIASKLLASWNEKARATRLIEFLSKLDFLLIPVCCHL